jgi:hypothetical protein
MWEEILLIRLVILAFSKWLTSLDEPELQAVSFGLDDLRLDVMDENEMRQMGK